MTGFLKSIAGGYLGVSEYLIQNGSSIHEKDKFGRNGIMIAIEKGHNHMIDELIKLKINRTLRVENSYFPKFCI